MPSYKNMFAHKKTLAFAATLLLISLLLQPNQVSADTGSTGSTLPSWELVKAKADISIYIQTTDNNGRKFRGVTRVRARAQEVEELLLHPDSCTLWRFRCGAWLRLSSNNYYIEKDLPWPLSDRYALVRREATTDTTSGTVTLTLTQLHLERLSEAEKQLVPEHKGLVEMVRYSGLWKLEPGDDGLLTITYEMHVDPGGNIPKALANAGATKNPLHTLRKLRKLLLTGN